MRLSLIAAALSLLSAPALAADCTVNMRIQNTTPNHVSVQIESRTRANPNWFGGGQNARLWRAAPGTTVNDTVTFPILGCRVDREVRAIVQCLAPAASGTGYNAAVPPVSRRVVLPLGDGLQRPRDFTVRASC